MRRTSTSLLAGLPLKPFKPVAKPHSHVKGRNGLTTFNRYHMREAGRRAQFKYRGPGTLCHCVSCEC